MTAWDKIVEACYQAVMENKTPNSKQCSTCGETKPREEFYARQTHSKNALMSECKICTIERVKKRKRERRLERNA